MPWSTFSIQWNFRLLCLIINESLHILKPYRGKFLSVERDRLIWFYFFHFFSFHYFPVSLFRFLPLCVLLGTSLFLFISYFSICFSSKNYLRSVFVHFFPLLFSCFPFLFPLLFLHPRLHFVIFTHICLSQVRVYLCMIPVGDSRVKSCRLCILDQ